MKFEENSVFEIDWLNPVFGIINLQDLAAFVSILVVVAGIIGWVWRRRRRVLGPSLSLVKDNDEKLILRPELISFTQLSRLQFQIELKLANDGGMTAIVEQPNVTFEPEDNVRNDGLGVDLVEYYWNKPTGRDALALPSNGLSIAPKNIEALMLTCSLRLFSWGYRPPKECFSNGSNLRRVHEDYFDTKKQDLQNLLSKIEPSGKIGTLKVSLMTSKTSGGNLKMVRRTFLDGLEILIDKQHLGEIRSKLDDWNFEVTNTANIYLNFLGVVEQQGKGILDTLQKKPSGASHISFPDEHNQDMTYAREALCIAYPEFADLWKKLMAYKTIYPAIITSLREQARGRKLDTRDEKDIMDLEKALENVLDKCTAIRATILSDFRP